MTQTDQANDQANDGRTPNGQRWFAQKVLADRSGAYTRADRLRAAQVLNMLIGSGSVGIDQ